jgi:predicted methyltransferase MtxX (methanogen marker protein 4)
MPRIQEYNLESEGQGPVGGLDPRVEAASAIGHSVRELGQTVTHEGEIIHHRQAQAEVSGVSAQVSQAHVDFNQMLQQQTTDGTLDVDNVKQQLDDWQEQAGQNISTAEGRNYFNKTAGRLKLAITQSAIHGSAQIAAAQQLADWQTSRNASVNSIYQDPSALGRVLQDNEDDINARVAVGSLPAKKAPEYLRQANAEATMASIDGWSRLGDTGRVDESGKPLTGAAIAKLALDQGQYDKYLTPQQKQEAYGHIDRAERANDAHAAQVEAQAKRDARLQWDKFLSDNLTAYANGTLSAKKVLDAHLPPEASEWQLHMINQLAENARRPERPADPRVVAEYMHRLVLPDGDPRKINNPEDSWTDPKVRPADAEKIMRMYSNTPGGKDLNTSRKLIMDAAKAQIVQTKDIYGNKGGYDKLAEFQTEMVEAERAAEQAGTPRRDLYNPNKPGNLYDLLKSQKFQNPNSLDSILNQQATSIRQQVLPAPPPTAPGETPDQMHKKLLEFRAKRGNK